MTGFEIVCIGRECQDSEGLLVPLSMSCLWIDMFHLIFNYFCHVVVRSLFHVSTMSKVTVKLLVEKYFVPCPQSHCAVAVSPYFLRFNLTRDCPGVRLSIQARTAQSHIERSATPSCGRAAFSLAKNSARVFRDLVCHDIFSSCALMRFLTVGHQVCEFDLSVSSTQLKPISCPRPPGYKVCSLSPSWSAPSTASLSASSWSGSPE